MSCFAISIAAFSHGIWGMIFTCPICLQTAPLLPNEFGTDLSNEPKSFPRTNEAEHFSIGLGAWIKDSY